ncbi:MAG TPA: ABC transporter ATP-binding protein [Desulfosalsimonadaceae bacterium]|nr:ABC transporter ATP-binding protein [Desulfosalsimonadaceae bacterium]
MTSEKRNRKQPLLSVEKLSVTFNTDDGRFTAAEDIWFDIGRGESVGLVGESGCGKSVTALSLTRLIPSPPGRIESGAVVFDGSELLAMDVATLRQIRGNAISMIFQEPLSALSPLHRIGRQLVETVRLHRQISKKEAWGFSEEWLRKVGIPDSKERMYSYPYQLSGGMQQRIMIAMALMLEPALIIADEPTTALDVTTQAQIFDLLQGMKKNFTSLLLITHDMGVVWEMCERVIVMYAARIVETGSREAIFQSPAHPYTIGLLGAIPRLSAGRQRLKDIPGQVPSPFNFPTGCHFQERCPYAFDRCRQETPPLYDCGDGQKAACFLLDKNE